MANDMITNAHILKADRYPVRYNIDKNMLPNIGRTRLNFHAIEKLLGIEGCV